MKLFNFYKGTEIHLGVMDENGTARDATAGGYPAIPATMQSAIDGTYTLDAIRTAAGNGSVVDTDTVRFAPAVLNPEKFSASASITRLMPKNPSCLFPTILRCSASSIMH